MTESTKGFCLGATQPDIPPPAPQPARRYALRTYQLGPRQRCLPTLVLTRLPVRGD
ncbi:MAG: hypothetical protein GAK43_02440 [Stenotrophomonas maltophilia]|nr:MAG: hypothetical protein GAK43_02440 [Stenotrophomonas maltophilia]